jgi:hypothetical protein
VNVFLPRAALGCIRERLEAEVRMLTRRLKYQGGRKARSAERRMRKLQWLVLPEHDE